MPSYSSSLQDFSTLALVLAQTAITIYHRLGGLNTNIYFSQFWKLESPRPRCWQVWCLMRAFSCFADDCLLAVSSHGRESLFFLYGH